MNFYANCNRLAADNMAALSTFLRHPPPPPPATTPAMRIVLEAVAINLWAALAGCSPGVGPLVYLVSSLEKAKQSEGCCKLGHGSVLKSTWQSDDICIIWQLFSNCNNNFSLIVLHSQCFNFHSFYYCPQKVLPPYLIIFLCLGRVPHTETFSIQL